MKVTIAICTRERPNMLSECLSSIQSLDLPENCRLHVVVVENSENPRCEKNATELMSRTPSIGFSYGIEPELGISTARNTSVEIALETDPDWIAFIDDDEVVRKDWLQKYHDAMQQETADVYTGPVERVLTSDAPIWYKKPRTLQLEHLSKLDMAATNNTIAKAEFFNGKRMSLRFDEACNFLGGEDTRLFCELVEAGGIIRFVGDAQVIEHRSADRSRKGWLIRSSYHGGNQTARMRIDSKGRIEAARFYFKPFVSRIFYGILNLLWGTLIFPFSKWYIRYMVKGMMKIAWTAGFVAGFLNIIDQFYKNRIDGD